MAGVGHVRVDTTVGTVCAAALLRGLVDLDVLDDQIAGIKTLGIGIGLSVPQEIEEELGGLDGPPGLGDTELLSLCASSGRASITPHGHGLLLLSHILEVSQSALELPSIDRLGRLAGVLEGDAEVAAASPGGLCVVDFGFCVADHRDVSASMNPRVVVVKE